GVVSDQFPAGRGAGALPPLLLRFAQGGVPDGLGAVGEPAGGGVRAGETTGPAVPAGCTGPAPLPRRGRAVRHGSALARAGAIPRVLPRRNRAGAGGESPDGVDGACDAAIGGLGTP